jgi:hypothetical protein
MNLEDLPETATYGRLAIFVNATISVVVALLLGWWANGFAVSTEALFRVAPTIEGGGVGTDWVAGNTIPALDALIALTHAADVLMGVFILIMVFIHWGAFRRLAGQMQQPGESAEGSTQAMADGGDGGEEP